MFIIKKKKRFLLFYNFSLKNGFENHIKTFTLQQRN